MSSPTKSPRTPTPRKKHHCTRCGAPMLGHKRGQCQTPTKCESRKADVRRKSVSPIESKMKALDITSEDSEEKERSQRRRSSVAPAPRPETLVSLSSNDKATLEILAMPGMMSAKALEDEETQVAVNVDRWRKSVPQPVTPRRGRRSQGPSDPMLSADATQELQDVVFMKDEGGSNSLPKSSLHRTYSAKEMDDFLDALEERSTLPKTRLFRIPAANLNDLKRHAERYGLFARGVVPKIGEGWVVVGSDKATVEMVSNRVASDEGGGGLRSTLGPGFVGAAITWLALAYS